MQWIWTISAPMSSKSERSVSASKFDSTRTSTPAAMLLRATEKRIASADPSIASSSSGSLRSCS